ncbi:MAG: efflux RND transporter periplasmic adaptor subunit [Cyanobacteria bacterium TGS_CYA1]|nr:efflux RND transporter periplasmic adaptor subunit [Cyanobacteria bacterium TGS_CYA1]
MRVRGLQLITIAVLAGCLVGCGEAEKNESAKESKSIEREVDTVKVVAHNLKRTLNIPAEISAFRDVSIYPKVQGFVKSMHVDRGSMVKQGQLLVEIDAPELEANFKESQAKFESASSALIEAEAKIQNAIAQNEEDIAKSEADSANYKRIQNAAKTPGAIAPVDIESAQKTLEGSLAHVRASKQSILGAQSELEAQKGKVKAAGQALKSLKEMMGYLKVSAPFAGIIKERNVHEGSLVSSSSAVPMLRIADTSKLRLIVPIPESAVSGIKQNEQMQFSVPAFVGRTFTGTISRISHVLDRKTRTMLVELDVQNARNDLAPGMYAEVVWTMERPYRTLFVPSSAVMSAEDKTFVIKVDNEVARVIPISRGQPMGDLVEITGDIREGDQIVLQASDEFNTGAKLKTHLVSSMNKAEGSHDD